MGLLETSLFLINIDGAKTHCDEMEKSSPFCENGDRDGVGKNRGQLPCGSGHAINLENQGNGLTQGKGEVMK